MRDVSLARKTTYIYILLLYILLLLYTYVYNYVVAIRMAILNVVGNQAGV